MFVYVGDCKNYSFKKKLEKKIKERNLENLCHIYDHMNLNDLRIIYYLSNLIISAPLKPEGFGRIISEAISMKKIILAYNYGGVKDQLNLLDDIYKIEPKNKKNLIEKINIALKMQNEKYENISNVSRNHIINFFSKEKMLNKYLELYLSL